MGPNVVSVVTTTRTGELTSNLQRDVSSPQTGFLLNLTDPNLMNADPSPREHRRKLEILRKDVSSPQTGFLLNLTD